MDTRLDSTQVDGGPYVERNNGYLVVPTGTSRRNTGVMRSRTNMTRKSEGGATLPLTQHNSEIRNINLNNSK